MGTVWSLIPLSNIQESTNVAGRLFYTGAQGRAPRAGHGLADPLYAFALHAPEIALKFRDLYATIAVLHSFVHGGVHTVVYAMRLYPADKLVSVLQNRNLLEWFTANCADMVAQNPGLLQRLRLVQEKHACVHAAGCR
jgi:hypothetical protein